MLPSDIYVQQYNTGHVQGIAIDTAHQYMYFSFTTRLVKTDMTGKIIGSVKGLAGHLGCIAFNPEDGRVYGSLEYKHDVIGRGILNRVGGEVEDGFYIAIFDVDAITREEMDAETDGVMKAVFLKEVLDDYAADGHRFGCSGIDGTTLAPAIGQSDGKLFLYVAYGIYGDTERSDNDHQVILCYDIENWSRFEAPLNQQQMHRQGPNAPDHKYFVYTGNTNYGIQNLEYDAERGQFLAAVYCGKKETFPNYPMFVFDQRKTARKEALRGLDIEGEVLSLAEEGLFDEVSGISGYGFPFGATGMIALGNGSYYFSEDHTDKETRIASTHVRFYRREGNAPFVRV